MSKTNKNEPFGSSLEVSTVALGGCGQVCINNRKIT
jgi:hypothetical protein